MAKPKPKTAKLSSLRTGRPPLIISKSHSKPSLSSKATRTLIRSHHQLQKAHAQALASNDEIRAAKLQAEIDANGGIEMYQEASKKGQSSERGGDSSRLLVEWLREDGGMLDLLGKARAVDQDVRLRCLEVGALSTQNAISKVKGVDVVRIDLNSQEKGILQQDFMERPLPKMPDHETDTFHMISLSLVLNYVPEPVGRGEMLRRTVQFLCRTFPAALSDLSSEKELRPILYLVLPIACVLNSRYLTEQRLDEIMNNIGYTMTKRKESNKLISYIWEYQGVTEPLRSFRKEELNPGRTRNNFAVVMR